MSRTAAVVGAGGIGAVHAREYARAGIDRIVIVGRSPESARMRAAHLTERLGVRVEALDGLRDLDDSDVVDVSLCTPTVDHLEHLLELAAPGRRILCEKPLFWAPGQTLRETESGLARLQAAPGRIRLNTPNSYFLEAASALFGLPERPARFRFEFFTQGSSRGPDIAVDLLPHALSMLGVIDPDADLSPGEIAFDENRFVCRFGYGAIEAEFDFREAEGGEKRLAFELDGAWVERVPSMRDGAYRVALRGPVGDPVEVEDPFAVAIRSFLAGGVSRQLPDLAGAARLTRQMTAILLASKQVLLR